MPAAAKATLTWSRAFGRILNNNVTHRINDVGIVTDTADQSVSAIRTIKGIVAATAVEDYCFQNCH